jgi:hypothetical protein
MFGPPRRVVKGAPKIFFGTRRGAMVVAARNAVCRGPVFRRRAMKFASRSLTHDSSHSDARSARVEMRFAAGDSWLAAVRCPIRPKRFAARHAATRRSPQRVRVSSHCGVA